MDNSGERLDEIHARFELPNAAPRYPRDTTFRIDNLSLSIEVDMAERSIDGKAVYMLRSIDGRNSETISLDAKELAIKSVTSSGKKVEFTHFDDLLTFSPGKHKEKLEVIIEYSGRPESGLYFISAGGGATGPARQAWSQGEDEYSRYWFPCFDAPNMKFTTDFHVTVGDEFTVVSNGKLTGTDEDTRKRTRTYHWKESVPHSSYLNSIAIGRFSQISEKSDGIELQYFVEKGREEQARRSFSKTPDMMKFFSEIIGVDYPYEKYSQVAVSDFMWGGMENVSATTLTDETLHDERAENDFPSHPLVAHELAHQWWGDLVTTKDWSNVWLNEGFATYFEAQFRQHDRGQDEFEYLLDSLAAVYFREDAKNYRRPIVQRSYLVPTEMFDRTTYQKGALVLHMLRSELGDELFYRSLNAYCNTNKMKNVETADLIRAIEETTGRNMQLFFDQWVYSAGYPEFEAKYTYSETEKSVELKFRQVQKTDALTPLFNVDLEISIAYPDGSRKRETARIISEESRFVFHVRTRPAFVSIDPHNSILKKMKYERPVDDALAQLTAGSPFEKVLAARELGGKSRKNVVEALKRQLGSKNFWAVHAECADALGRLNRKDALEALISANPPDSRARKQVVRAIGSYRDASTATHLQAFLNDVSYAVQAEAVAAISTLQNYDPEKVLEKSLGVDSHQDVVRQAALAGFAEAGIKGNFSRLKEFTTARYRPRVRGAAIRAIARLGKEDALIRRFVYSQLRDDNIVYRRGVVDACILTENPEAIPELQSLIEKERDGILKRQAFDALQAVRRTISKPEEISSLSREIEAVRGEVRELKQSIESIEKKLQSRGKRNH